MWLLPLYLHGNQKSDYDMMMSGKSYVNNVQRKVPLFYDPLFSLTHDLLQIIIAKLGL